MNHPKKPKTCCSKAALIAALFLFMLCPLSFADKDYSLPQARVDYWLNADGTIRVTENITYSLSCSGDCFHELYVQKPTDLRIRDASGYCIEAGCPSCSQQCGFFTQYNEGWFELVLRDDDGYASTTYYAVFEYTIEDEILEQEDAAQFFFKLWGEHWEKPVGTLTAVVHLPGDSAETEVFVHPVSGSIRAEKQGKDIVITSPGHPSRTYLEANIVMPKEWFSSLRRAPNFMTRQEIIDGEKSYIAAESLMGFIKMVLSVVSLLFLPVAFLALYIVYGREKPLPQLETLAPYEREPPSSMTPAEAGYLLNPTAVVTGPMAAEILWLAHEKYFTMEQIEIKEGWLRGGDRKVVGFRPVAGADTARLVPHQKKLYDFMTSKLKDGVFCMERLDLGDLSSRMNYSLFYSSFKRALESRFEEKKYMEKTGNNIMLALSFIMLFAGFIPLLLTANPFFIILIFEGVVFLVLVGVRPQILGKWSEEGRVLEARLQRYRKFMEELTLMKEKQVMDIILWEQLLIYATAFGVADKVMSAMKVHMPDYRRHSSLVLYGMAAPSLYSTTSTFTSAATGRSGGGFCGGGGGGGGGGGAR